VKINQILDKIDDNHLFVPAFQREYVWKRDHAKDLVASLIRKYPTGTMLVWETTNPPELKGNWKYNKNQGAIKIILDGQQRITTLYLLVRDEIPPYYKKAEIKNDPRNLYVNIDTLDLQYYKESLMKNDPYWLNITDIFQKKIQQYSVIRNIENTGRDLSEEERDDIADHFNDIANIPDSEFLEQSIPIKASLKEAINIFYIVNDSGVSLTDAELALAQISGYWPKAREQFKNKLESLKEEGFEFKLDFIIYCLLGVLHYVGSDMTKLHSESNDRKLREAWKKLDESVLDYVINLLRTHAYVDHVNEINSVYALIPIVVYIFQKDKPSLSEDEIKKIVKWFYYSQIRQRYISQLPQKLDKDLGIVVKSQNPFDELLNIIKLERPLEINPEEFIGVGVRNALYSLMRWYFKSRNAICFTTGVGIRQNMGAKYSLEWDHIFPYSLLKDRGYNVNNRFKYALAQEITNRIILTQVANRTKSNSEPKKYLSQVRSEFPKALKLQTIPQDENLWEMDRFWDFLHERRKLLAKELNQFLSDISVTEELTSEITLLDLISEGETNELEFKESLRWNVKAGRIDKKLEEVILKSVAAFSNAEGGTLLIGVSDDGTVEGLDQDYRSLNGNRDEFEIHLRNLLNRAFGKRFAAVDVTIAIEAVDGSEVCKINVSKGQNPLYLEITDANGNKTEKFYVRSGNTSQELNLHEVHDYIKTRF
jgi:hypothetical protein